MCSVTTSTRLASNVKINRMSISSRIILISTLEWVSAGVYSISKSLPFAPVLRVFELFYTELKQCVIFEQRYSGTLCCQLLFKRDSVFHSCIAWQLILGNKAHFLKTFLHLCNREIKMSTFLKTSTALDWDVLRPECCHRALKHHKK